MPSGPKSAPKRSPGRKLRPRSLSIQPVIRPGTTAQKKISRAVVTIFAPEITPVSPEEREPALFYHKPTPFFEPI
jgi:hypothetical protein